jgi:hypothetical protein
VRRSKFSIASIGTSKLNVHLLLKPQFSLGAEFERYDVCAQLELLLERKFPAYLGLGVSKVRNKILQASCLRGHDCNDSIEKRGMQQQQFMRIV